MLFDMRSRQDELNRRLTGGTQTTNRFNVDSNGAIEDRARGTRLSTLLSTLNRIKPWISG
jgi:hypothetical protein